MQTHLTEVIRYPGHQEKYTEIKDPSVVRLGDGSWMMFATIGHSDVQSWAVGRFVADDVAGPWRELEPVRFHGLAGPQLCAPAVVHEQQAGADPLWRMFIQTACFAPDGVIALATSRDGLNFHAQEAAVASRHTLAAGEPAIIGVYDAGVTRIRHEGRRLTCLLFTGCNRVGDGDIYISLHDDAEPDAGWTPARRILRQDEVPFHNRPAYEHYEWGLEGASLVQLDPGCYLLVGVCFLELGREHGGTRQRVFLAAAKSPLGPYVPIGTPLQPHAYDQGRGENGHPEALVDGDELFLLYQERAGERKPWHLRHTRFQLDDLRILARAVLGEPRTLPGDGAPIPMPLGGDPVDSHLLARLVAARAAARDGGGAGAAASA